MRLHGLTVRYLASAAPTVSTGTYLAVAGFSCSAFVPSNSLCTSTSSLNKDSTLNSHLSSPAVASRLVSSHSLRPRQLEHGQLYRVLTITRHLTPEYGTATSPSCPDTAFGHVTSNKVIVPQHTSGIHAYLADIDIALFSCSAAWTLLKSHKASSHHVTTYVPETCLSN